MPAVVAEAIRDYLTDTYVQVGAGYPHSKRATEVVAEAHRFVAEFMNVRDSGVVALGPSTTQLINLVATAFGETISDGDEIVVATSNHESNIGPWVRLAKLGAKIEFWDVNNDTGQLETADLVPLLTEKTRLVAFPHVSNLLGDAIDVAEVSQLAHSVGAQAFCDGVAYAPHRAMDVSAWNVDWYIYSTYKVFGPHMAALFGKSEHIERLSGPNHFFIKYLPGKFELGSLNHEGCAGILALRPYLRFLSGTTSDSFETVKLAFDCMQRLELPAAQLLVDYVRSKSSIRLVGSASDAPVGIVSFVHRTIPSDAVVAAVDQHPIGIRFGHMYAYRLLEQIGIAPEPGVVRVSLLHYNTVEEVDRLIQVFDTIL